MNKDELMVKVLGFAGKVQGNKYLTAISQGLMQTLPILMIGSIALLLAVLPIDAWQGLITDLGIKAKLLAGSTLTTSLIALYSCFCIGYQLAIQYKQDGIAAGLISVFSFLVLTPLNEGALDTSWLSAQGLFAAMIASLVCTRIYVLCIEKNLTIKMPEGVPPMVSESFEPIFVSMIIVAFAFAVRVGFGYTPYGSFVNFFDQTIGGFIIKIGLSLPTIFLLYFAANLLWFFGIHPNTVYSAFVPLQMTLIMTNMADLQAGRPLTYLTLTLVSMFASFGGNGNTIGLCLSMFTAKSERYKKMLKLAFIPNLFNINEPLIFGMPVMLNPVFFIPMVFCNVVMGLIGLFATQVFTFTYNPAMSLLPWTTPFFVKAFMAGGISLLVMVLILLAVNTFMYYPFFRMADKKACEEERLAKAGEHIESVE